jgi:hypothetical protein
MTERQKTFGLTAHLPGREEAAFMAEREEPMARLDGRATPCQKRSILG